MQPTCTHVAILARDVEKAIAFYRGYAGLREVHRRIDDGVTVVWLAEPGRGHEFVIVLIEADHADAVQPSPLAHIGYAVDSRKAVDSIADEARREGYLVDEPKDAGPVVGYFCILSDPDGNLVEFSYGQSLGPRG